jgi:hypothetical protein
VEVAVKFLKYNKFNFDVLCLLIVAFTQSEKKVKVKLNYISDLLFIVEG